MNNTFKMHARKWLKMAFLVPMNTHLRENKSGWIEERTEESKSQRSGLEAGRRMRGDGLGRFYHLREVQAPYNSDFTPENSDLRAENAYF
jgi:hypothetical protein